MKYLSREQVAPLLMKAIQDNMLLVPLEGDFLSKETLDALTLEQLSWGLVEEPS